ncbi:MAG: hypothetical protein Q4G03_03365 [Planctomycetia bacterium]|nr:hypothetical protein [Planctomycetia bacterium]
MKRSALQCVVGFVGATLIIVGVIWTCRQLSSPTELNAAQDATIARNASVSGAPRQSSSAPITSRDADSARRIRSTSATSQLRLSLLDDQDANSASQESNASLRSPGNEGTSLDLYALPETGEPSAPSNDLSYDFDQAAPLAPLNEEAGFPEMAPLDSAPAQGTILPLTDDGNADYPLNSPSPLVVSQDEYAEDFNVEEYNTPNALAQQEDFPAVEDDSPLPSIEPTPLDDQASPLTEPAPLPGQIVEPEPTLFTQDNAYFEPLPESVDTPSLQPIPQSQPLQPERQVPQSQPVANQGVTEAIPSSRPTVERTTSASNATTNEFARFFNTIAAQGNSANIDANELLGAQSTQIVVEKIAPEEVQANKEAVVVVKVKNLGARTVRNILLYDQVPEDVSFIASEPAVTPGARGELIWAPFDLEAQREKKFEYRVVPTHEGEFGSVATVFIAASAYSKTKCSKPELKIEVNAPEQAELGQPVDFTIVVSNVGTGDASNVALFDEIPEGLYHPNGSSLDNKLGTIKAGESKQLSLTLQSVGAGVCVNRLIASADDCEEQEVETSVKILAPQIELGISGPESLYLEQRSVYRLNVKNSGDATARNIQLVVQLPESVEFINANNYGVHRAEDHCVYWDLAELPSQSEGEIELAISANKLDRTELTFRGTGPNNLSVETSQRLTINGLAALSYNVTSSADLIETGKELEYTIQIVNRGTKESTNVILQVLAPEALNVLATDGPTQAVKRDGVVVFDKIPEIPAKTTVTYKIKVNAVQSGDCRVGFQLSSDDLEPLGKEVNTRVYQ